MSQAPRPFAPPMPAGRASALPYASVMLASLLTALPLVASLPLLPPLGLLVLLGWRLQRADAFPIWAALPLGLFDDLVSGQPLGSAMLLWTIAFMGIDLVDRRLPFRDFRLDWLIAAAAIVLALVGGRLLASPIAAQVDMVLIVQIVISVSLFPLAARLCAWLDRKRGRP